MIDVEKVKDECRELKQFFTLRGVTTGEAKECMFRLIEYIDTHYADEDKLFMNGNGHGNGNLKNRNNYKPKGITLKVEKEMTHAISSRANR